MKHDKLSVQSMDFAVNIIALVKDLKNQRETIISNQIGRSGPGSRRSPGEGNGNPLEYSCLENPMDGEA